MINQKVRYPAFTLISLSMSFSQTLLLGTISGLTIFIGMPVASLKAISKNILSFLNSIAIGVLFFLFVDVITNANEPIATAVKTDLGHFYLLIAVMILGVGIGLMGLVYYTKNFLKKGQEMTPTRLAMLISIGIGLHNFSEGLAIGNSALNGQLKLALVLIIGFGLHNITEAFAIAAPLAGKKVGWKFLIIAGLIAGGPNLLGTVIGYSFSSEPMSVFFLATAAGAIIYVIGELLAVGRKFESHVWMGWGILIGFFLGLITDLILIAVGA